jgi:hypothetical protein
MELAELCNQFRTRSDKVKSKNRTRNPIDIFQVSFSHSWAHVSVWTPFLLPINGLSHEIKEDVRGEIR